MNTTAATGKGFDAVSDVLANAPQAMLEEMSKGGGAFGKFARLALEANRKQPGSFTVVSQNQAQNSSAPPPLTAKEEELINLFEKGAAVDPGVMNYGLASLAQKRKAQVPPQPQGIAAFGGPPPTEGVPSLGNRQDIAEKLAAMGRYEDDEIAHVAEGEVIVPAPIMKYYPEIRDQIFTIIRNEGFDPNEFVVGDEMVARNPTTGLQEFSFLSKAWKKIKKVVKKAAPIILGTALMVATGGMVNPFTTGGFSALASGVGQAAMTAGKFALANPGTAGFLGGTAVGLGKGKNLKDALKLGLQAGAVTGTLGGVFGTQGIAGLTGNKELMAAAKPGLFSSTAQTALNPQMVGGYEVGGAFEKALGLPKYGNTANLANTSSGIFSNAPDFMKKIGTSVSDSFAKDAIGTTTNLAALGLIVPGLFMKPEEMPQGEEYVFPETREGIPMAGLYYDPATGTYRDTPPTINVIQGPIRRNDGGEVAGPGTGTSDSIPAMLSDGEFVMTAKAVRAMGDGDRQKGAAKMYQLMNRLEGKA